MVGYKIHGGLLFGLWVGAVGLFGATGLSGCTLAKTLAPLSLHPPYATESRSRFRFPAQTLVWVRFANSDVPDSWADAAHAGVLMHFPKAQRRQRLDQQGGLEWFVRWPALAAMNPTSNPAPIATPPRATLPELEGSTEQPPVRRWYDPRSITGPMIRGSGWVMRGSARQLKKGVKSVRSWAPGGAQTDAPTGKDPRINGHVQVVLTDRISGQVLAMSEVQIAQDALLQRWRCTQQRNTQLISAAFEDLASALVAGSDSD